MRIREAHALSMYRSIVLATLGALASAADPVADRVLSLPGWSDAFRSQRFAGYLSGANASRRLSYFFVESERDPGTDPVVLWLNGGALPVLHVSAYPS